MWVSSGLFLGSAVVLRDHLDGLALPAAACRIQTPLETLQSLPVVLAVGAGFWAFISAALAIARRPVRRGWPLLFFCALPVFLLLFTGWLPKAVAARAEQLVPGGSRSCVERLASASSGPEGQRFR